MKSMFAWLFVGLISCVSTLQSDVYTQDQATQFEAGQFSNEVELLSRARRREQKADPLFPTLTPSFGYATRPAQFEFPFPLSNQVRLKTLSVHSRDVTLARGSLKVPAGAFRFTYGVNLRNTGSNGGITTWLSVQASHLEPPTIIPFTLQDNAVEAAGLPFGFSVIQVYGTAYFQVDRPSLISVNYSAQGKLRLSSFPRFTPCCGSLTRGAFRKPPVAFYVSAVKL